MTDDTLFDEITKALDEFMAERFGVCVCCGRRKSYKHYFKKKLICRKCAWRNSSTTITLAGMIAVDEGVRIPL